MPKAHIKSVLMYIQYHKVPLSETLSLLIDCADKLNSLYPLNSMLTVKNPKTKAPMSAILESSFLPNFLEHKVWFKTNIGILNYLDIISDKTSIDCAIEISEGLSKQIQLGILRLLAKTPI